MKNHKALNYVIYLTIGFLFILYQNTLFSQGVFTSKATGVNWSTGTTSAFNLTSGSDADGIPDSDDAVIIATGHTINVTATATCLSLTLNAAATANGIAISSGVTLTVSGSIIGNAPTASATSLINVGDGNLSALAISITGGTTTGYISELKINAGSVSCSSLTVANNSKSKLTFTGAGTLNVGAGTTNTFSPGASSLITLFAGSTINYDGAAQTVYTMTYQNLKLSGSGVKTMSVTTVSGNFSMLGTASVSTGANLAISGSLSIGDGCTFTPASTYTLSVGTTTSIGGGTSGSLVISSTSGSKTFTGLVTVNSGGIFNNSGNCPVTYNGGITNSGTFTAGSGIQTFITSSQALTGTISIPNMTVTGVTVTNNNTLTVSTALAGTGGLTQAASASLVLGGTSAITTITASNSNNTVEYSGAAQTVHNNTYVNLTLSGSGKKSMKLSESISGTFTLSGTAYREYTEDFEGNSLTNLFTTASTTGTFAVNNYTCSTGTYAPTLSTGGGTNNTTLVTVGIKMVAYNTYSVTFNQKNTANIHVYAGSVNTTSITSGTVMYSNASGPTSCTSASSTQNFVPTSSGTYYIGFNVINNTSTAVIDDIVITESIPATNTWLGTANDSNWDTGSNWSLGVKPTSSDIIVIPTGKTYYPSQIPSGNYFSLSIDNGKASGTTTINASSITRDLTITSSSTGNTVSIGSTLTVGGNISIGASGSAFNFNCNGTVTGSGTLVMGNTSTALTSTFSYPISVTGTFTLANNSSNVTNISYSTTTGAVAAIRASNSGSFVFYGAVNYTATSGDQIVMKSQYNGPVTCSGAGNRFMEGDLDINDNLTISGGKWYSGSTTDVTFSGTLGTDANVRQANSPYKGSSNSARWQGIFLASDILGVQNSDVLTSLSFFVKTKYSNNARPFKNFTIKVALTSTSSFSGSAGAGFTFLTPTFTTVFTAKDVTTTANAWNTHVFDTPFAWDGTSNVLVQITFNNNGTGVAAPSGSTDDEVAYNDAAWGTNIIDFAKGSADVTNDATGNDSNYKSYSIFNVANGPYNINITNNWLNSGGSFYHLQNTVTFDGSTNQNVTTRADNFYNYTVNNSCSTTALTLLDDNNVEGTATLTDGVITTGSNKLIILSSTASKLTGYSNASFVKGNLRRYITTNSSTYGFPLGKGTATTDYFLSDIINNSLTTTTYLDGKFVSGAPADYVYNTFMGLGKQMTGTGVITKDITSLDTKGYTQIDPNVQPGGGSYSYKMYSTNYTTSGWSDNDQCIMKRASSSVTLNDFNQAGTVNADNGLVRKVADGYLLSTGLTSFSIFEPGLVTPVSLSIKLLDFTATLRSEKVYLDWSTITENHNDFFTVERSQDGHHFTPLFYLKGYENSTTLKHYNEIDQNPLMEISYYRLKQTDTDGKSTYSQIRAIQNNVNGLVIFPNPAVDNRFQVEYTSEVAENVNVFIYDNVGQVIYQNSFTSLKGANHQNIQLNHPAKGLYILHLRSDSLGEMINKIEF